jgi:cytochrome oxidase Cu insertion factor (SCO1/SenC/PrrC family)
MNPQAAQLRRSRLTLVLLGLLFVGPLLGAWGLYIAGIRPSLTTNYGTLVQPTTPLPALALRGADGSDQSQLLLGRWSLIQLGGSACDAACTERLVLTRQVRLALGAAGVNKDRVQLVHVVPDEAAAREAHAQLAAEHKLLHVVADVGAAGGRLADVLKPVDPLAVYLVDPNGNWLMTYSHQRDDDAFRRGLLKDLKKLLRLSSIG